MKNAIIILAIFLVFLVVVVGLVFFSPSGQNVGSIQDGQAYNSTTTNSTWNLVPQRMLKTYGGTLGSVVVTKATAGVNIELRDATSTTDLASTTITTISSTATSGTYTFDVAFTRGLAVVQGVGNIASTTITWR